jgi:hypothetical protein
MEIFLCLGKNELQLLPLESNEMLDFTVNETRYVPNLPVEGRIKVAFKSPDDDAQTSTNYLYGRHQGKFFITISAPAK